MRKHSRGAVTVFVTLLLIPAVLVSGTGVDISRVYAARSTTRDANQLAANALMTNYDTLLQDLYSLYGVIGGDDELTGMVDLYVRASLFGEDVTDAQLGEFRLFGGHESVSSSVSASDPLSNVEILRRQIEEFSKYRVPVAIVSDILDRLKDSGADEMAANTQAAAKKLAVDEQVEEVVVKFSGVLDKADTIHKEYLSAERTIYSAINGTMERIEAQLVDLAAVRREYENETDPDKWEDIQDHYDAIVENIRRIGATGGKIGSNWIPAHVDDAGNDVPGAWETFSMTTVGLKELYETRKDFQGYYRDQLDELMELCGQADAAKGELERRIRELEVQLNGGGCSAELAENMGKEIETYKKLLDINFTQLGQEYQQRSVDYMDQISTLPLDDMQGYSIWDGTAISFANLETLASVSGFEIDFRVNTALYQGGTDMLQSLQGSAARYEPPQGLIEFRNVSPAHAECCELLEKLDLRVKAEGEELTDEEKEGKDNFTGLFKTMKDLWDGLTDYDPAPGAASYPGGGGSWAFSTRGAGMEMDFGMSDFQMAGGDEKGISATIKTFTSLVTGKTDVVELFGNVLSNAANRVLLVGYATQMFSNWSYKGAEGDAPLSLTGKPIDAAHNYFYNSEWEYLINGELDAGKNLGKATMTILAIRFLANYASSYMIREVNSEIKGMEEAVSAIPYAGGVLRFLVRPLYVLGESVVDVSLLRSGYQIPLLKTNSRRDTWRFSLDSLLGSVLDQAASGASNAKKTDFFYTDYLVVFMLVSEPDVLASRIGDLIALNVTTVKNGLPQKGEGGADARADAAGGAALLDLSKANTTFEVKTSTQVRFMFLSMPFAQQGVNGVVPPTAFPVTVTDYRGY